MTPFPPSEPAVPPMATRGFSLGALFSLVLGLLSVGLLLSFVTGVPAIIVGILAIRRINHTSPPPRGQRLAFTGILLGLAGCLLGVVSLVAVFLLNAREKSQRAECTNNLRQIGRATSLYHETNQNTFPPGAYYSARRFQPFPPTERMSWLVTLLPYLDRPEIDQVGEDDDAAPLPSRRRTPPGTTAIYERFHFEHPWTAETNTDAVNTCVRIYLCPAYPFPNLEAQPAQTHYIGSAGLGLDAPTLPLTSPRAGMFGYERVYQLDPGKGVRGQSNTLLCGESTRQNGAWAGCGPSSLRGVDPTDVPLIGRERTYGGCHRGGANLLMVDGHVIFFNERGSPEALSLLIPVQEFPP